MNSIIVRIACIALLCCVSMVLAASPDHVVLAIAGGDITVGVYFTGSKLNDHDHFQEDAPEHFLGIVSENNRLIERTQLGSSFIFRSSDLRNRLRLDLGRNYDVTGAKNRPYQLTFYNLAYGDRDGDFPVELQHGNSGYLWLEGSHYVTHDTSSGHAFTVRDMDHRELFTVVLYENRHDEL